MIDFKDLPDISKQIANVLSSFAAEIIDNNPDYVSGLIDEYALHFFDAWYAIQKDKGIQEYYQSSIHQELDKKQNELIRKYNNGISN